MHSLFAFPQLPFLERFQQSVVMLEMGKLLIKKKGTLSGHIVPTPANSLILI